jgi:hypothetical protein
MAYPFFALAKSKRIEPIIFNTKRVSIRVSGTLDYGIATIWDADVLIWAASQIIEARDQGLPTSRLIATTPYHILRFVGRGTNKRSYDRLKAALTRLQSTTVTTSLQASGSRRLHQFSWLSEWKVQTDANGRLEGISMILPDWFYTGLLDSSFVLTLDPVYFQLTGGLERWFVPSGAQACGPPTRWLAIRCWLPSSEVRQRHACLGVRVLLASPCRKSGAPRLRAPRETEQERARCLGLSSASSTARETVDSRTESEAPKCLEAVNSIVLSRIERHALSHARLSCYHEYEIDLCPWST